MHVSYKTIGTADHSQSYYLWFDVEGAKGAKGGEREGEEREGGLTIVCHCNTLEPPGPLWPLRLHLTLYDGTDPIWKKRVEMRESRELRIPVTLASRVRGEGEPREVPPPAIPLRFVQTWRTRPAPDHPMTKAMESLVVVNGEFDRVFFDDVAVERFLRDEMADEPRVWAAYEALVPTAYRADLFRYCYLWKYGGFYADCKLVAAMPFLPLLPPEADLVLCEDAQEGGLFNAFFGAVAGHPLLRAMIDQVVEQVERRDAGVDNLDITGPTAFGRCYRAWAAPAPVHPTPVIFHLNRENCAVIQWKNLAVFARHYPSYYKVDNPPAGHYSTLWERGEVFSKGSAAGGRGGK